MLQPVNNETPAPAIDTGLPCRLRRRMIREGIRKHMRWRNEFSRTSLQEIVGQPDCLEWVGKLVTPHSVKHSMVDSAFYIFWPVDTKWHPAACPLRFWKGETLINDRTLVERFR